MINYSISNTETAGKIYSMNPVSFVYGDDSVPYTSTAQLPPFDHGTSVRKFYSEIELICDRELSSSPISILYSDDDYQSFTIGGELDLSDARPRALRLGSGRKRIWAISHSAQTPFRIEYLQGTVRVGR
jgi:hypothetical protein